MAVNPHRGIAFPFRFSEGRVRACGGGEGVTPSDGEVAEAIKMGAYQVLMTERGERVMLYNFGLGAAKILFSGLRSALVPMLQIDIEDQITFWVPRALVQFVGAAALPSQALLLVQVQFTLADRDFDSAITIPLGVRSD